MAVDNPPLPAPAANSRLAAAKDVALIVSGLGGFSAVIIAATALVVSMTLAPLRDDVHLMRQEMQLMRQDTQRGFEAVDADFKAVDDELKAVRKDLADLSERLTRVETLLEQGAGQTAPPDVPETE